MKLGADIKPEYFQEEDIYNLVSYAYGSIVADRVWALEGVPAKGMTNEILKQFSATAASSGGIALFHMIGVTPEAQTKEQAFGGKEPKEVVEIHLSDLAEAERQITNPDVTDIDAVVLGCPHCSYNECAHVEELLRGRRVNDHVKFWLITARSVLDRLKDSGLYERLIRLGVEIYCDGYTVAGHVSKPEGNRDPAISPFDAYKAKDGAFVMACGTDGFWKSLCEIMGQPELAEDPRFINNTKRCEYYLSDLKGIISAWTEQYTVAELEEMIVEAGIPFGRILSLDQVCRQETLLNRNMLWTVHDNGIGEEIQIPGTPIKMHGCEDQVQRSAPTIGQDTDAILADILHLSGDEIARLHTEQVI